MTQARERPVPRYRDFNPGTDRLSDYQAFQILRGGGGGGPTGINRSGGRSVNWVLAQEIDLRRQSRMDRTLGTVYRRFDSWRGLRGRKSLLLLSEGFIQDDGAELRDLTAAAREANAAVYFFDVRGLLPIQLSPDEVGLNNCGSPNCIQPVSERANLAERIGDAGGAVDLADDTGGFAVRNSNDLGKGLARAAAEARVFYLLGFYPPGGKSDTAWRKLRVEVKRRGLKARARPSYRLKTRS